MNSKNPSRRAYGFKDKMTLGEKIFFGSACTLAAFLTAIIQTSFFFNFRPFGFAPDLCLALSAAVGVKFGPKCAGIVGLLSGFFVDCFSSSGVSLSIPFYIAVGLLMGFMTWEGSVINLPHFLTFLIGTGGGALAYGFLSTVVICLKFSSFNIGDVLFKTVLPEILITVAFSLAVYPTVALVYRIIRKKQGFLPKK